jgi:CubicO group peptidase (beta-lactamase class C family)
MKQLILSILLIPVFYAHSQAQDNTSQILDKLVSAYAGLGKFNGSVLVAREGKILLQKGYGIKNAAEQSVNDEHSIFQIASITKSFTATVILKLVELKKLSLADKLSKYYSGFPNGDSITIEHLLRHTSGVHNFTETDTSILETDEKRMIPFLRSLRPDFVPGAKMRYSNSGYVLLGYIIQKASGMTYWKAVRKYIFEPLKMNYSGFDFAHLAKKEKATGYATAQDAAIITDSTVPSAAGAIYSTVSDLYKFHRGLQSFTIVPKAIMEKAYQPGSGYKYGFGWTIDSLYGHRIISHSGSIAGFGSNFARVIEDDICIVLLSNHNGSTFDVMNITGKLLAILYSQPYSIPVKRVAVLLSEEQLKKYTGSYELKERDLKIEIFVDNGRLIAQPSRDGQPGPTSIMIPQDENRFYDELDNETEANFVTDESGKVTGFNLIQRGTPRFCKKIK